MNADAFETRMRSFECYHDLRLLEDTWVVIRVDGRGFSRFTESHFEKPFDERFHALMVETARTLLEDMQGLYAYTESDEISVLFRPEWSLFDRELEKLVSLSAGIASSAFSLESGQRAHFDSRIWIGISEQHVLDYFRWRQTDAGRCALNGWAYWTLRRAGMGVGEATRTLDTQGVDFKNELLFQHGINFNDLPLWQRRGTGLYHTSYSKEGFNPLEGRSVLTTRRRVFVDRELPLREEYAAFLRTRMQPEPHGLRSAGSGSPPAPAAAHPESASG